MPIYNRSMPRKVILGFGISLDGYIARRNGAIDFLVMDKEGEKLMADFFANSPICGHSSGGRWKTTGARGGDSAMSGYSPMILINARFLRPPSNSP